MREPRVDPQRGDRVEHHDGGTMYVWHRTPRMVCIARRPFGDSQAEPHWVRLSTFQKWVVGGKESA